MPEIAIAVNNKIPSSAARQIVCDNSDYTLRFTFDGQWEDGPKTVYFVLQGVGALAPAVTDGDVCQMPPIRLSDGVSRQLAVGVQQGQIKTSAVVNFWCYPSAEDALIRGIVEDEDVSLTWLEWVNQNMAQAAENVRTAQEVLAEARTAAESASENAESAAENAESAAIDAAEARISAQNAEASARSASESAEGIEAYARAAEAAKTAAQSAADSASASSRSAQTAKTEAETAKTDAQTAKTAAETARTGAETAQSAAEAAAASAGEASALIAQTAASPIKASASGFPLILGDAAEGRRFQSVRIPFGPAQAGTGDPSPDNVRPLSPRIPTLYRCGPNLYTGEGDTPNTGYNAQGVIGASSMGIRITDHIPVSGESEVVLLIWGAPSTNRAVRAGAYDAEGIMLNGGALILDGGGGSGFFIYRVALPAGTATIRVSLYGPLNLGVYAGSKAESFTMAPPEEAGDVYGGVWDPVTGTLTVDRAYISLIGAASESWFKAGIGDGTYFRMVIGTLGSVVDDSGISSHFAPTMISGATTDVGQRVVNSTASGAAIMVIRPEDAANATVDTFKAWLAEQAAANTPVQVCWRLTEPAAYSLTPVQITALAGLNTIWADCGPVEIEYIRDTGAAIEAANADTRAMIGEASGVTASRSLAVGEYVTVGAALYRVTSAVGAGETLVPGSNVVETTVGAELTGAAGELAAHKTDAGEELRILAEIADRTYAGRDLTAVFAPEISQSGGDPWAWIKGRITAGNYDGIHVGDWIPYTDTSAAPKTRNARIMGIDTYRQYGDTAVGHHIDFWGGLWTPNKSINKANYNNGTSESEFPWLASDAYLYANSLAGKVPSTAAANPTLVDVDYTADGILYYLPETLKAQIKTKRSYLEKRYTAGELLTESPVGGWADLGKIWFPTEYEVYGAPVCGGDKYAGIGSAVQYPFFMGNMNRLAFGRTNWWLITPRSGNSAGWCFVYTYGLAYSTNGASVPSVAAPICFRIA